MEIKEIPSMSYLKDICDGDEEFYKDLLQTLVVELDLDNNVLIKHLNDNNLMGLRQIIHKIKHKVGMMGLENVKNSCESLEVRVLDVNFEKEEIYTISKVINNLIDFIEKQ